MTASMGTLPDPEYMPPHLRGKVRDFRNESDGAVSFDFADRTTLGLTPEEGRIKLQPEQFKQTFDPQHRRLNFWESMQGQFANRRPVSTAERINHGIADTLRGAFDWGTSDQAKSVGTAGLLSALAGGAGGYALGKHTGDESPIRKALLMALLAGVTGVGATAYAQRNHNKREAMLKSAYATDETADLIQLISDDPSLSNMERSRLLQALAEAGPHVREELHRTLRSMVGSGVGVGVGALVTRFLQGRGLLSPMSGGILSALLGSAAGSPLNYDARGNLTMTNYLPHV